MMIEILTMIANLGNVPNHQNGTSKEYSDGNKPTTASLWNPVAAVISFGESYDDRHDP